MTSITGALSVLSCHKRRHHVAFLGAFPCLLQVLRCYRTQDTSRKISLILQDPCSARVSSQTQGTWVPNEWTNYICGHLDRKCGHWNTVTQAAKCMQDVCALELVMFCKRSMSWTRAGPQLLHVDDRDYFGVLDQVKVSHTHLCHATAAIWLRLQHFPRRSMHLKWERIHSWRPFRSNHDGTWSNHQKHSWAGNWLL